MIRITVEGHGHEKVGMELKHFFQTGQRKIVRHFREGAPEDIGQCDIAIIEIKDNQEVKK